MDPSARHLWPWKRGPYLAVLVGALLALLAWVIVALSTLLSGDLEHAPLCSLVCVGVLLVGASLPAAIWRRRGMARARTTPERNEDALAALRGARYAEAEALWNELCHDSRHAPALHTLYVLNLGVAWMHLGRLEQARALIERAHATGWLASSVLAHARPQADVGYALCLALAGDVPAARRALEAARPALGEARRAATMLADAVIEAREGRELAFDEEALRRAESSLMVIHIRALRLLEAFTRARAKGAAYREAAAEGDLGAIGVHPGELDFLGAAWPELRAFLESHALVADRTAAPDQRR